MMAGRRTAGGVDVPRVVAPGGLLDGLVGGNHAIEVFIRREIRWLSDLRESFFSQVGGIAQIDIGRREFRPRDARANLRRRVMRGMSVIAQELWGEPAGIVPGC